MTRRRARAAGGRRRARLRHGQDALLLGSAAGGRRPQLCDPDVRRLRLDRARAQPGAAGGVGDRRPPGAAGAGGAAASEWTARARRPRRAPRHRRRLRRQLADRLELVHPGRGRAGAAVRRLAGRPGAAARAGRARAARWRSPRGLAGASGRGSWHWWRWRSARPGSSGSRFIRPTPTRLRSTRWWPGTARALADARTAVASDPVSADALSDLSAVYAGLGEPDAPPAPSSSRPRRSSRRTRRRGSRWPSST